MSLHKIYNFVGYNNLGLILEQERKHWLLKPDKKLNVQNADTGSIFQGRLDNMGNEIVVETNKTDAYTGSDMLRFSNDMFNDVFEPLASSLPYNIALNGLMYECIISSKIAYEENNSVSYKNYKIKFKNAKEVIIPFGNSLDLPDVYAGKWIMTTSVPVAVLPDSSNAYTIEVPMTYISSVTGCVFYYPLEPNLQPLELTNPSSGVYVTEAVTDHTFIGYPIYWFTSDNTNVGPSITISNNVTNNKTLMYLANPGNVSKYIAQIFCGIDGNNDAVPSGTTADWKVTCKTKSGVFTGTTADAEIPLDMTSIKLVSNVNGDEYDIPFVSDNNDTLTLAGINNWSRSGNTASVTMSTYDQNCYLTQYQADDFKELIPLFQIHFDENVSFLHNTTDVGYAGIDMMCEPYSETNTRYPYGLDKWDGIPTWMQNNEEGCPQHVAVYAIHNTPNYNEDDPTTRQTSAIILDPGKPKTSADVEFTNDERGRAYLLSNDPIEYENNATTENPKPARTIARICDIPSSLAHISDISGLAPTTVVDKRYVHTDACYTEEDRNRLYNTLSSRWVCPTMLDGDGHPIIDKEDEDNNYIFNKEENLNTVDLYNITNDLCEYINLNPYVEPDKIALDIIADAGSGYTVGDEGVVIIGGTSITYQVTTVDDNGGVTGLLIAPPTNVPISLSNFDLIPQSSGNTSIYGTSPVSGTGTGLKFSMIITNYESIRTKRSNLYADLFALVKLPDGLWLYQYNNGWKKTSMVSEAENSTVITANGGLSTTDSYMTTVISSLRVLPIANKVNCQSTQSLNVMTTAGFVNIIDEDHIPYADDSDNRISVEMNKLVCMGIEAGIATQHDELGVYRYLNSINKLGYDCYVFWKWQDRNNTDNNNFTYGIVRRSFNNYQSTDSETYLPYNQLRYQSYVHTNEQTTVVWNTNKVGTLLWVYDPRSSIGETYTINRDSHDISINRTELSFNDIDVYNTPNFRIADEDGKLLYNISTNNSIQHTRSWTKDTIYQQPDFQVIAEVGTNISGVHPIGVWKLVYPRVNSYKFSNSSNGLSFDAIKMDVIRGDDLGVIGNIMNQNDEIVNAKILVLDRQTRGTAMRAYNSQTKTWDTI